jgi:diadenosine tetraphosphate (Ap4A) HIT family hydrolase
MDAPCGLCALLSQPALFEDDLWHVRHIDPPWGVAGWMLMIAKRHLPGPGYFDDREAASFGPSLRRFAHALEEVTGALRIYTAALGEMHPHFHCHLVPRLPDPAPKGWALFDLQRAAAAGEVVVSAQEVERISAAYRAMLER